MPLRIVAFPGLGYAAPFALSAAHIGLGQKDLAFEWLEKAYQDRNAPLYFLRDSRYAALVRKRKLEHVLPQY